MLYAQGNNIANALAPGGPSTINHFVPLSGTGTAPDARGDLSDDAQQAKDRVLWHNWTATITPNLRIGDDPVLASIPTASERNARVIGVDRPLGVLVDRVLKVLGGREARPWDDVGVTELGVLAWRAEDNVVYVFRNLDALLDYPPDSTSDDVSPAPVRLSHPLLTPTSDVRIYTAYTRALLVCNSHVLQLTFDRRTASPVLAVVDELAGLGVARVSAGGDRFGVLTPAGEVYLVEDGVERLSVGREGLGIENEGDGDGGEEDELDELEIEDVALGDGFIAVLSSGRVYARGDNTFGQLGGLAGDVRDWTHVPAPGRVSRIYAGRFSLLVDVEA